HFCKQEEGQSVSSYVLKMKGYIDNLERLRHPVTLGLAHAYAPKPKIPPQPKREDPAKDSICHECGEMGHWKRKCPQYLAELLKKKTNTASGAGGSGLRASRKLKPGALSLYVGNGQREAVEAIGNFDLSLPSGLVIVLNNCHYAPSITRGVISVSRLYEDGFINRFVNNTSFPFVRRWFY
ncbi:FAR-RED impaired response 1-like protein, partial [Tanacetum coccineum]